MASKVFLGRILTPKDPQHSFAGKTVIVTGANTGLGFEAAAKFVRLDAQRVIIASRNTTKGEAAKAEIVKQYGHKDRIDVWQLEMDDYDSVRRFADKAAALERLDMAVLNAGVCMNKYRTSRYGWEETLQVNTISTAMLALLLLPKLKQARTDDFVPVLELVGSTLYSKVDKKKLSQHRETLNLLETYSKVEQYSGLESYNVSKLFLMHVLRELARMVDPAVTLVTSTDPGPCGSDLGRDFDHPLLRYVAVPIMHRIFRTPEQGSRTLVSAAVLGPEAHGGFWAHDKIQP